MTRRFLLVLAILALATGIAVYFKLRHRPDIDEIDWEGV
jgi:hypothetical protein